MSYATIEELRSQLGQPAIPKAYADKQLHPLPQAETVKREEFILERVKGKCVLEFGATGSLHDAIVKAARKVYGFDRPQHERPDPYAVRDEVEAFDLDDVTQRDLPQRPWPQPTADPLPEIIVCGELLEHLSNPGWFLTRLKRQYPNVPVLITVPNAYAAGALRWLARGTENVNRDHVAFYSPKTLSVLLQRAGYVGAELYYYNGQGPTAEGLIVVTE